MNCQLCRELMVVHLEGSLNETKEWELAQHMQGCPECRAFADACADLLLRLTQDAAMFAGPVPAASIMERITQNEPKRKRSISTVRKMLRIRSVRLSAAAASVVILVGAALFCLFGKGAGTAYALEQTVEANKGVRTVHVKFDPTPPEFGVTEAWAQFDEEGDVQFLRMDKPASTGDPWVLVCEGGKATFWLKDKNTALVVKNPDQVKALVRTQFFNLDPKYAIDQLYQAERKGDAHIASTPGSTTDAPIKLTVTFPGSAGSQELVWTIDPKTSLALEVTNFVREGDQWKPRVGAKFLDYNKPIDPSVFALNLPPDAKFLDYVWPQGNINSVASDSASAILIVSTGESDKVAEQKIRAYVQGLRDRFFKDRPVITDEEALKRDLSANTLIIYGTPTGNAWLARYLDQLPMRILEDRIVADKAYAGNNLRFITAWPNPQNSQKGVAIYTAQRAEDIPGINAVFHGPTAYVVAKGTEILHAGNYDMPSDTRFGGKVLPVTNIDSVTGDRASVVIVVPTQESDKIAEHKIRVSAEEIRDTLYKDRPVITDEEALKRDLSANTLIVYGTPTGNAWLARYLDQLPVRISKDHIVADREYAGDNLRLITVWLNPQNPKKGAVIYTAQRAEDIPGINSVFHGPTDYVIARETEVLEAGCYDREKVPWGFQ